MPTRIKKAQVSFGNGTQVGFYMGAKTKRDRVYLGTFSATVLKKQFLNLMWKWF